MNRLTEKNIYYLNQMDIVPWISKEEAAPALLLIFISTDLSEKAKVLLQRIRAFLNLNHQVLTIEDKEHNLKTKVEQVKPKAVLVFAAQLFSLDSLGCTLRKIVALDLLLKQPSLKKKLFEELTHFKNLVDEAAQTQRIHAP